MQLGKRGNLLEVKPEYARRIKLESPILNDAELEQIQQTGLKTTTLSTLFTRSPMAQMDSRKRSPICVNRPRPPFVPVVRS